MTGDALARAADMNSELVQEALTSMEKQGQVLSAKTDEEPVYWASPSLKAGMYSPPPLSMRYGAPGVVTWRRCHEEPEDGRLAHADLCRRGIMQQPGHRRPSAHPREGRLGTPAAHAADGATPEPP